MIWYYLKSAFRNIRSNKKFSVINITGFAFGISICLAIVLFLVKEYSYDKYHDNANQIVRLIDTKNNSSSIDYRVKDILLENYPELENACIVQRMPRPVSVKVGDKGFYLDDIMSVDNNFFEIFTIPFVSGKSLKPFDNINSAVITESTAKILFGTENPLGKNLIIMSEIAVTITGVIKDFPGNSSISAGLLVNAENRAFKFDFSCTDSRDISTHRYPFRMYFLLNKNINEESLIAKINSNPDLLKPYNEKIGFLSLKDIYLHDKTNGSQTIRGNVGLLQLLTGIALIILTLAIINYINLTVAQQNKRSKETGVRKTVGAFRENLLYHFLSESVLVSFIAMILAILLVWLLLPFYSLVFNTTIDVNNLFLFPNYLILIISILFIGLISGIGPAIVLSGISPIKVLNGSIMPRKGKGYLRNSLTIFQFAISIILIFCVTIIQRQISYVKHKDPGFSEEQLLKLDVPAIQRNDIQKAMLLLKELRKSPYVKSLSISSGVPGKIKMSMGTNIKNSDKNISISCLEVDTAFLKTFDIKIIKGRNLKPGDFEKGVCMINKAAYKHFEWESFENKRINNGRKGGYEIIGVVNDFHYNSLHKTIGPVCIMFTNTRPSAISVRIAENSISAGMDYIQKTWQEILPGYPLKYQFYDDWFDAMYRKEERFAKTIGLFAILAIIISCIGILGLAIFSSERRIKEIGIRKVNGAKVSEILTMLNKDFIKWVAIAYVIACPIAYYAMNKWLENFAYKTTLSWWIFALAGVLALGIALLTVSWQSWRAATRNPVEALRYE